MVELEQSVNRMVVEKLDCSKVEAMEKKRQYIEPKYQFNSPSLPNDCNVFTLTGCAGGI